MFHGTTAGQRDRFARGTSGLGSVRSAVQCRRGH